MSREGNPVYAAIDRWEDQALIDSETARKLRREVADVSTSETRRFSQYVLAATGGVVLLLATGLFLDWAWPLLGEIGQALVLAVVGLVVIGVGVRLEESSRWIPASYLLQTSGLLVLLAAFIEAEDAWSDTSPGGVVAGALSLAVPIVLAPRAMRRGVIMPAIHFAMSFAFLAVFLDMATPISDEGVVWVLDGVLLVSIAVLGRLMTTDPGGVRHAWVVPAFVTAMFGGLVLVALTAFGPLGLQEEAFWPLDAWLALCVAVAVLEVERGHPSLSREWVGRLLALMLVLWIGFGFATALETLDGPAELALLLVGGAGVIAFAYGNARDLGRVMGASALAFISALWYWAVDRGGAIGAALALAATAALIFWISGRTGPGRRPVA